MQIENIEKNFIQKKLKHKEKNAILNTILMNVTGYEIAGHEQESVVEIKILFLILRLNICYKHGIVIKKNMVISVDIQERR